VVGSRTASFVVLLLANLAAPARGEEPPAPVELTIPQAAARQTPGGPPLHEGRFAIVSGIVSAPAIRILNYAHLGIHDGGGRGFTIESSSETLRPFVAGDEVRAEGTIGHRAGLPVLQANKVSKTGHASAAPPVRIRPSDAVSPRYLGLLVTTEGRVVEAGANTGGEYLLIGDSANPLKIFLPLTTHGADGGLIRYENGDKVQVTGLASQYCPLPPFDRMYQIVVPSADSVVLLERGWLMPPYLVAVLAVSVAVIFGFWWIRERKLSEQRLAMRALNQLGEEVLSASSPADILDKLSAEVPALMRVTDVHLYIYRPATRSLERIAGRRVESANVPLDAPEGTLAGAVVASFRNRTLLVVPDTSRSPLFRASCGEPLPRAVMLVPMLAQNDPMGVLALCHGQSVRNFNQDEQASAQHFGNQVAVSLKLLEQRTIREQLFRSEKLAATGQLISGIVDQLEAPLDSIMTLAGRTLSRPADTETKRLLAAIASEARRASEIVSRLMSFARAEKVEAKPVEINSLLSNLMDFLAGKWKAGGIQVTNRLSAEPIYVLGFQGQLEQVFLNLFVHAEQAMAGAEQREMYISASLLARRVLIAISYTGPESALRRNPFAETQPGDAGELGLGVCRGIIQSHSGEMRFVRSSATTSRFEVELPVVPAQAAPAASAVRSAKRWTVLVLEPDQAAQRQLLVELSAKGARVIPVSRAEDAVNLVERTRFDVFFCAAHPTGSNWLEIFERVRPHIGAFVLLTDGLDADLAGVFQAGDGQVLRKPIDEGELGRLIAAIEARSEQSAAR